MARRICSECGTTINTENVEFSRKESSLVYLDKVYSYNQEKASVFLQTVSTEGSESLISELTMGDTVNNCNSPCGTNAINPCNLCVVCCGTCGSSGCTLDANAVFTVERSYVLVDSFELATPTDLATTNVSIEGNPVSSLTYESGQFSAGVNTLLPNALRCKCLDNGIPSKVYFLVEGAGPWIFAGRIVIETTGGISVRALFGDRTSSKSSIFREWRI